MRLARCAILCAVLTCVAAMPGEVRGEGILEAVSGNVETIYSYVSTKTTDASGNTTNSRANLYGTRLNLNVNFDLYPKLNLNFGGVFEKAISDPEDDADARRTEATRLRPFVWLTFRDPIYNATLGYDLKDETLKVSGGPDVTLTQENYNANLEWRPDGFPWTKFSARRTNTHDAQRASQDTEEGELFLKSEYIYKGLDVYYAGRYLNTQDKIHGFEATQWFNEGRLIFSTTLFNGRTSLTTDNRLNVATSETKAAGRGQISSPLFPLAGLSAIDETPQDGALTPTPALIDGNLTASAGLNIGVQRSGDIQRRNIGLDFLTSVDVNSLLVWVDRELPQTIASSFSWDIYTSTDNVNWALHLQHTPAVFGPFLTRFELSFPTVRTRFIKAVTRPLSPSPDASRFPDILITEIEAVLTTPVADIKASETRVFQNYTLDVKTRILDSPALYHDFNSYYSEQDPTGQRRYNVSNGLFLNHRFTPILSSSANASVEFGSEGDETRVAFLYYASLLASPLRTLSNSLVFSGIYEGVGGEDRNTNSVTLYNTAQLYKGVDVNLNLGSAFTTEDHEGGNRLNRIETYGTLGANVIPHPSLALTAYYTAKWLSSSARAGGSSIETLENRLDLGASWTPFRTLSLSAAVSFFSQTREDTRVQQSYGVSWAPFPDGNLQFSFYYNENYFPERSRLIQPIARWYLGAKRRSYLEASYALSSSQSGQETTDSQVFTARLNIFF